MCPLGVVQLLALYHLHLIKIPPVSLCQVLAGLASFPQFLRRKTGFQQALMSANHVFRELIEIKVLL